MHKQSLKTIITILFTGFFLVCATVAKSQPGYSTETNYVVYFGDTILFKKTLIANTKYGIDDVEIARFYTEMNKTEFKAVTDVLLNYKNKNQLDDWLFYQLIRRTAQQLSSKYLNYNNYTLCKWFLLVK